MNTCLSIFSGVFPNIVDKRKVFLRKETDEWYCVLEFFPEYTDSQIVECSGHAR